MGPILRHVFEPDPTPFCEVPVKLPPFPDTRHFSMGPILGLRFFSQPPTYQSDPGEPSFVRRRALYSRTPNNLRVGITKSMSPKAKEDDSSLPLERMVPPPIVATPSQMKLGSEDDPTWWQPGWHDVKRFVGWRWVLLAPAVLCVLAIAGGWYFPPVRGVALVIGVKLGLAVFAFAFSLVGYVTRMALKAGSEPFCIYCGYNLTGLPDEHRCPECGRAYTHAIIAEYRKDPSWFIERWKLSHRTPPRSQPFASGPVPRKYRAKDGTE